MKQETTAILAAGILAIGLQAGAQAASNDTASMEKCAGVAKMGKNDCGALDGSHGCSGQSKKDDSKNEWIYVAEGTCDKLTGGELVEG